MSCTLGLLLKQVYGTTAALTPLKTAKPFFAQTPAKRE